MAKGLRSKVKKRNRAVMRSTVGKAFQQKVLAETTARMASKTGSRPAGSLMAIGALLNGGRAPAVADPATDAMEADDDDEEEEEEEEEVAEGGGGKQQQQKKKQGAVQTKNVGMNAMPKRTALRGTKNMRKYGVKPVVHVYKGRASGSSSGGGGGVGMHARRIGRSLPGSGKRRSGKPKTMVTVDGE
jgi:hypothetical protein